jgi:VIT1/CCC1 family predicted Fe2+/Mn2+ transporter
MNGAPDVSGSFVDGTIKTFREQKHRLGRSGWLRAAVLGADDGIVSTASLIIGVASASASRGSVLLAGAAGLVAGAMAMGAGEYISVYSQRDIEEADIALEHRQLLEDPEAELDELAGIYIERGVDPELARKVAEQLSARGRLKTHLREELGLHDFSRARPLQAAAASALSFASLAIIPLAAFAVAPDRFRVPVVAMAALAGLTVLGAAGAVLGGAPRLRAALRVLVGGGFAMAISALVGKVLGVAGL